MPMKFTANTEEEESGLWNEAQNITLNNDSKFLNTDLSYNLPLVF